MNTTKILIVVSVIIAIMSLVLISNISATNTEAKEGNFIKPAMPMYFDKFSTASKSPTTFKQGSGGGIKTLIIK